MGGSNLHTDLQTQQMVWKFGPTPCEQLLLLLWSKLNALIWQEFRNANKSADPPRLQHVSHCGEAKGPFCFHVLASTFKAEHVPQLPKGNCSQSSLSLMLIPYCWNSISLSAQRSGPHAGVTNPPSSAQAGPWAPQLQREGQGLHSQDRTVTANKEALHGVDLTSRGCFDFFFSICGAMGLIFIWTFSEHSMLCQDLVWILNSEKLQVYHETEKIQLHAERGAWDAG